MARTKKVIKEDIKGKHLTVTADGNLKWDWDALLKEVQEATGLISVTETKVKKTRAKKEVATEEKPKRTRKKKEV